MLKSYQIGEDKTYCYPGTNVLKNMAGIKVQEELQILEMEITAYTAAKLKENPVRGNLDFEHLKKIHKALFGELYPWAGRERTVNIAKGNLFCLPQYIYDMSEEIFNKLKKENYLLGKSEEDVVKQLAFYIGEINALHPFREGNGRTQREYLRLLSSISGYKLNFKEITQDEMIKASEDSLLNDNKRMESIIKKSISQISYQEQWECTKSMLTVNGSAYKAVKEFMEDGILREQERLVGMNSSKSNKEKDSRNAMSLEEWKNAVESEKKSREDTGKDGTEKDYSK